MQSGDFDTLVQPSTTRKDDSLASMEAKLDGEKDARKEERFVWILICIILVDCLMFMDMQSATAPLVILTLELVLLVIIAKRLGIEDVAVLLDKVINKFEKK